MTTRLGYVYVDNIGVLGTSLLKADDPMPKVTTTFDDAGLLTHGVSVSDAQMICLGSVLDCERLRSSLAPRRFGRLRRGIDAVLNAKNSILPHWRLSLVMPRSVVFLHVPQ